MGRLPGSESDRLGRDEGLSCEPAEAVEEVSAPSGAACQLCLLAVSCAR